MTFTGKWKLAGHKNVDEICNVFGVPDEKRKTFKAFLDSEVVDEISEGGNTWSRKTFVNGEKKRDISGKFGADMEAPPFVDLTIKVKAHFTKISDTKITGTETFPQGDVNVGITVEGDKLTQTATVGPVVFSMEYKRM